MRFQIMTVHPHQAAEWLKHNTINRPLRPSVVKQYATAMAAGDFPETHQAIAIGTTGVLLDGQHRLHGVIQVNKPVRMAVAFDVPEETFAYLDKGLKRTTGDSLGVSQKVAEVVNLLSKIYFDNTINANIERVHTCIGAQLDALLEHCPSHAKVMSSAPMKLAAIARIFGGDRPAYVHDLYRNLVLTKIDELPPIGKGLLSQSIRNTLGGSDKSDVLARGLIVFNEKNRDLTRVQVKDGSHSYEAVRQIFKRYL